MPPGPGCKKCNGHSECGPDMSQLCFDSDEWVFAGLYCLKLFVMKDPKGNCKIKIVPCIPKANVRCVDVDCSDRKPVRKAAKKAKKAKK